MTNGPAERPSFRFAVNVSPKPGILDPQGRAVEGSLAHLGIAGVSAVRVGRRVELTVQATDERTARETVDRLATELLSNPLIEAYEIDLLRPAAAVAGARS
ncbi:MAG TPA: phosphoribosylformylglycinamidine synthase subunit PurS [Candidatus Limnocylindrales bacterium]|nr:phosphoribosylformylglycinamidine synthase subunit PurS [Candidatus Limnocylindrales bacterium]